MALNLGIYTADLSYASIFDQAQTIIEYYAAMKRLADRLGISNVVNDSIKNEFNRNVHNKDIITEIISNTFMDSNDSFHDDSRPEVASLLIVGGWIEGLHIALQLSDKKLDNKELINIIIDQKLALEDLISLLEINKEKSNIEDVITDLVRIKTIFDKINVQSSNLEVEVDKNNVTTVKSKTDNNLSIEVLKELYSVVKEIRTSYVQQ